MDTERDPANPYASPAVSGGDQIIAEADRRIQAKGVWTRVFLDAVSILSATVAALFVRFGGFPPRPFLGSPLLFSAVVLLGIWVIGGYSEFHRNSRLLPALGVVAFSILLTASPFPFAFGAIPRTLLLIAGVMSVVLVSVTRSLVRVR